MFCSKCGKENKENALYCVVCGSAIKKEKVENTKITHVRNKKNRMVMISVGIGVIVILTGLLIFFVVGMNNNRAELHMEKFVSAVTMGELETAYAMLPERTVDDLSVESFETTYETLISAKSEIKVIRETKEKISYEVSFLNEAETNEICYQYDVVRTEEKKLLFFPTWRISKCNMTIENIQILAPQNAETMIDGISVQMLAEEIKTITYDELDKKPKIYQDEWCLYTIPKVWNVNHTLKVTEDRFVDYEMLWKPQDDEVMKLTEIEYSPQEQWRDIYAKYIGSHLENFTNVTGRFLSSVPFGFFDVDGDESPEMFTYVGAGTEDFLYYVYTIRDGKVQLYDVTGESVIDDSVGGEMYITEDGRILVARFSSFHDPWRGSLVEYCFANGVIKENSIVSYTYLDGVKDGSFFYDDSLRKDNEISKKKFKKILKEYGCSYSNSKIQIEGEGLIPFQDIMMLTFENYTVDNLVQIERDLVAYVLLTSSDAIVIKTDENNDVNEKARDSEKSDVGIYMEDQWCKGYKMLVPEGFQYDKAENDLTGFVDGNEGTYLVWGGCRKDEVNEEGIMYYPNGESYMSSLQSDMSYSRVEDDYCCYSYENSSGEIYYCAYHFDDELVYGFELRYQKQYKEYYDSIIEKLSSYVTKDKGKE